MYIVFPIVARLKVDFISADVTPVRVTVDPGYYLSKRYRRTLTIIRVSEVDCNSSGSRRSEEMRQETHILYLRN